MEAFSPEVNQLLQREFALGNYASTDELLIDALHSLADRRTAIEAIEEGLADIAAGRVISAEECDRHLEASAARRSAG